MERILVIAPHADDEILGCGALMAKMAKEGKKVFVLVCTNASVGAPELFCKEAVDGIRAEAREAHASIGFLTEKANFLVFFFEKNYHFVGMGFLSHGTLPVTN